MKEFSFEQSIDAIYAGNAIENRIISTVRLSEGVKHHKIERKNSFKGDSHGM